MADTCGGASLLPKDKGGVVDPQLKASVVTSFPALAHAHAVLSGVRHVKSARRRLVNPPYSLCFPPRR
jgi:hypothetical protein